MSTETPEQPVPKVEEKPKEEVKAKDGTDTKYLQREPTAENEIHVASKGHIKNYLGYAFRILLKTNYQQLKIRATGNAIVKANILIELVKRRVGDLHQLNSIYSMVISSHEEKLGEKIETKRRVTAMDTVLSKTPLDKNDPGYQEPAPKEEPYKGANKNPKRMHNHKDDKRRNGPKLYNKDGDTTQDGQERSYSRRGRGMDRGGFRPYNNFRGNDRGMPYGRGFNPRGRPPYGGGYNQRSYNNEDGGGGFRGRGGFQDRGRGNFRGAPRPQYNDRNEGGGGYGQQRPQYGQQNEYGSNRGGGGGYNNRGGRDFNQNRPSYGQENRYNDRGPSHFGQENKDRFSENREGQGQTIDRPTEGGRSFGNETPDMPKPQEDREKSFQDRGEQERSYRPSYSSSRDEGEGGGFQDRGGFRGGRGGYNDRGGGSSFGGGRGGYNNDRGFNRGGPRGGMGGSRPWEDRGEGGGFQDRGGYRGGYNDRGNFGGGRGGGDFGDRGRGGGYMRGNFRGGDSYGDRGGGYMRGGRGNFRGSDNSYGGSSFNGGSSFQDRRDEGGFGDRGRGGFQDRGGYRGRGGFGEDGGNFRGGRGGFDGGNSYGGQGRFDRGGFNGGHGGEEFVAQHTIQKRSRGGLGEGAPQED